MAREKTLKIWDIWVRLFHWSLVLSVLFVLFTAETGTWFFNWHKTVGECVLLLLVFRLIWGLFGSSNARLSTLLQSPRSAVSHLKGLFQRRLHDERGHNPAGGWAVLAMLLLLSVQAGTGLFIADEDELMEGAFYGAVSSESNEWLYEVHHLNGELLEILLLVHVAMVAVYGLVAKKNLIAPMFTGRMRWSNAEPPPTVQFTRPVFGVVVLLLSYLIVAYGLSWAPFF